MTSSDSRLVDHWPHPFTIGSLFAGIGGLELGLSVALGANTRTSWQVEIDPFCRSVLARHWPEADRSVTDVRLAGSATLPPVDIICGGFPCQDISQAGKGAGLEGGRSGLWFHMLRVVCELQPQWVVIENVQSLRTKGLGRVLHGLADVGYDAEWSLLSAAQVGAPHLRKRLFIIAHLPNTISQQLRHQQQRAKVQRNNLSHSRRAIIEHDGIAQPVANSHSARLEGRHIRTGCASELLSGSSSGAQQGERPTQPSMGGASHGFSTRLDRWQYVGTDPEAWEQGVPRTAHGDHQQSQTTEGAGQLGGPAVRL